MAKAFLKLRVAAMAVALSASAFAQPAPQGVDRPAAGKDAEQALGANDVPSAFTPNMANYDYVKRVEMIPMRDGVKLYTVIMVPKGVRGAPIMLTRTPYDAANRVKRFDSPSLLASLSQADEWFVRDGYIRVFQDIRGKYGSEGDYLMTRPPRGPLNATATDDTTDAWDTIDWLVKNTPESNGKVGMVGSSYEGWTVVMALLDPHPALKAAAPESPMVDGWMGDDWMHYGAFRQPNLDYISAQTTKRGEGKPVARGAYDDFDAFRRAGSVDGYAKATGVDIYPFLRRLEAHPAYDAFWQGQALDTLLAAHPSTVPTMWEQGLWDQEDMWGAIHTWTALKAKGLESTNYLTFGPWRHSGANHEGDHLGPLNFNGDTAEQWRRDVLEPFFNQYLKDGAPRADTPRVTIYNTGANQWEHYADWPLACESGCAAPMKALYLRAGGALSFDAPPPTKVDGGGDAYVSDPAKPVPYLPRPVRFADSAAWQRWLVTDQRIIADRPDVLTYETDVLTAPVRIGGAPIADIWAKTSGTDADWVVKLIDVYPDQVPSQPELGGYQLPISLDIFRGRYRASFERPSPIPAGQAQRYRFALPTANHIFLPGHRIMVQVQSTLFPLYDRNPQSYVPNIFLAKPADYKAETQTVLRSGDEASKVWLPLVPAS